MPFVYTARPGGALPRAYVRLHIRDHDFLALIDTGSDRSLLPATAARRLRLTYVEVPPMLGIGGAVRAHRLSVAVPATIFAPQLVDGLLRWIELGTHEIRPLVMETIAAIPALVGRTDLLVHYRFTLTEREREFDLEAVT